MSQKPLPENLHIDTLAVRAAVDRSQYGENSEALYLTSGFVQPDAQTAARRFSGEEEGYTYGRVGNPTVSSFEMRLAALEGAQACIATSTGMSAILLMCLGLLKSGDHVICSHSVFGATIKRVRQVRRADHVCLANRCGSVAGGHAAQHALAVC